MFALSLDRINIERPTIRRIGGIRTMKINLGGERIVFSQRICENKEKQ